MPTALPFNPNRPKTPLPTQADLAPVHDSRLKDYKRKTSPGKRSLELENTIMKLPHMIVHKYGCASYAEAAKVIHCLEASLASTMGQDDLTMIRQQMIKPSDKHRPIDAAQVEGFIHKKFSAEERSKLYLLLSNYCDPAYYPTKARKHSLADALFNRYGIGKGYSLLMQLWFYPPKLVKPFPDDKKWSPWVADVQAACRDYHPNTRARICFALDGLYKYWMKTAQHQVSSYHYLRWADWMDDLVKYIKGRYQEVAPGHFNWDSVTVAKYMAWIKESCSGVVEDEDDMSPGLYKKRY